MLAVRLHRRGSVFWLPDRLLENRSRLRDCFGQRRARDLWCEWHLLFEMFVLANYSIPWHKVRGIPDDVKAGLEAADPPIDIDENNGTVNSALFILVSSLI